MTYKQLFKKPRQNAAFQKAAPKCSFSKSRTKMQLFRKAAPKCSFLEKPRQNKFLSKFNYYKLIIFY